MNLIITCQRNLEEPTILEIQNFLEIPVAKCPYGLSPDGGLRVFAWQDRLVIAKGCFQLSGKELYHLGRWHLEITVA